MPENSPQGSDAAVAAVNLAAAPAAAVAGAVGSVALEKGIDAAIKVIEMIRDKEIRERVTNTFNAVRADVYQAGYNALKNFNDYRKKLKASQRDKIQEMLDEADQKLQEAVNQLSQGVDSANAGNEGAAKEHFEKADKAGHEAADLFRKAEKKKHEFIAANAPDQPDKPDYK